MLPSSMSSVTPMSTVAMLTVPPASKSHDGQLTLPTVRPVTLAAQQIRPQQLALVTQKALMGVTAAASAASVSKATGLLTLADCIIFAIDLRHRHHHRFMSFVSVLSTGRTVPPIVCSYSYCSSIGVLEQFVFTGRMPPPPLTPNQAHQVCKEATLFY